MTIGVLQMEFNVPGSRSLKEKRRAILSLKTMLHNRFNCSVAETGFHEKWARAQLTACVVSGESAHANDHLNEIVRFAQNHHAALLTDYTIEML
jgi:hypothetical protein